MTVCEKQLEHITQFAKALLTPREICEAAELDYEVYRMDFLDLQTQVGRAYRKGILELKYEMNHANIEFAKQGSSHAMNKIMELLERIEAFNLGTLYE